jgi:Tol biopolymer transport system component
MSGTVQIFQINPSGTGLTQLTQTGGDVWNQDPSWSANASKIYFTSDDRSTTAPGKVYSMNATGSGRQVVGNGVWPAVNRAGSTVALVQYLKSGQSVIATMKSSGGGRKVVGNATKRQGAGAPDYAPTGARIAWYRVTYNKSGQGFAASDLFVRNGTHNTNITRRSSAKYFSPTWAPNGKTLVAIRGQRTLVSMRPNGTGVRVLTSVSGAHTGIAGAVYSPDGTKIAYLQCAGDCGDPQLVGQGSIWVMNANGSGKHRIFNGDNEVQPSDRLSWGTS